MSSTCCTRCEMCFPQGKARAFLTTLTSEGYMLCWGGRGSSALGAVGVMLLTFGVH